MGWLIGKLDGVHTGNPICTRLREQNVHRGHDRETGGAGSVVI
jgi:hypothetical protein